MHKGSRRVEIFRKGRIFVLRTKCKWLKSGMVALTYGPSRCGEIEMDVTKDSTCTDVGTAAAEGAVAVRTQVDETGDGPPPPRPREVRPCSTRPGAEAVRHHNLTHCPYQSWFEVCVATESGSDHYHKEAPEAKDGDVARVQMDFMFVGAEGSFVDEPRAKATVLMVICKDDGNFAATVVRTKTDEYGVELVLRFLGAYECVWKSRRMESPALWRLLDGCDPEGKGQRVWHSQASEVIKRLEQWNVRMEQFRLNVVLIILTCWIA